MSEMTMSALHDLDEDGATPVSAHPPVGVLGELPPGGVLNLLRTATTRCSCVQAFILVRNEGRAPTIWNFCQPGTSPALDEDDLSSLVLEILGDPRIPDKGVFVRNVKRPGSLLSFNRSGMEVLVAVVGGHDHHATSEGFLCVVNPARGQRAPSDFAMIAQLAERLSAFLRAQEHSRGDAREHLVALVRHNETDRSITAVHAPALTNVPRPSVVEDPEPEGDSQTMDDIRIDEAPITNGSAGATHVGLTGSRPPLTASTVSLSSELGEAFRCDPVTGLDTLPVLLSCLGMAMTSTSPGAGGTRLTLLHVAGLPGDGDPVGDMHRMRIAAQLRQAVRFDDLVVRVNSSTFAVLGAARDGDRRHFEEILLESIGGADVAVRSAAVDIDGQDGPGPIELLRSTASQLDIP